MDTTINQRIKEIADKLCDGNISELARIVDVKQPTLRDTVTGKQVKPGFDILRKIVDNSTLNINPEWLLTGKGAMQTHKIDIVHSPPYRDIGSGAIPVYDISAAANLKTLFANENSQRVLDEIRIPNAPNCDGAIHVRGDSMDPVVRSGDIIAFKQLHNIDNLRAGQMYLVDFNIDGDDFLVLKYGEWEEKHATLRLISHNKDHEDMVIPVGVVRGIALVKIIVKIISN